MKKILLPFICLFICFGSSIAQVRYIDEVFTEFTVDSSNVYAENLTVLAANATPHKRLLQEQVFQIVP